MFSGLASKSAPALEGITETGISFDAALDLISDSFMDSFFSDDYDSIVQEETLDNLTALEAAISKFGLSRALLAFADHNGLLSSSIAGIPTLESLTADLTVEESAPAIEGIGTTLKSFAKAYFAGLAFAITHPLMTFARQGEQRVVMWKHIVDGIQKNMSEKKFMKEKAEKVKNRIVPFEAIVSLQKSYSGAPKALLGLWTTELPKKEEEFGPWLAKVKSIVEPIFKAEDGKITDKGNISVPLKHWFILKMGEKGNLIEKGYDSDEKVKEVISGFRNLLQAYLSLKTIPETIKKHIENATKEGDEFDRAVVNKAVSVGKNITKALVFHGLWGVSGMSMFTIQGLKKAYGKEANEY